MAGEDDKNDAAAALAKANDMIKERDRALAIERAARSEAERRGTLSAAEAQRLKKTLEDSATGQVDTHISSLKTKAETLKKDYSAALAEGDFDKAADLQMQMGEVAAQLTNAQGHKTQLEHRKANGGDAAPGTFDKEGYIAKQSARTAAWLREHDEYFTNPALQAKVTGAHHMAIGNGLKIDSDEYFAFIEKNAGIGETKADDTPTPPARQPGPRPGPRAPAAPPTREGAPLQRPANLRPGDRYIPAAMAEAAKMCGVDVNEYHDEHVRLYKEGRVGDTYGLFANN